MKEAMENYLKYLIAKGYTQTYVESNRYRLFYFYDFCLKEEVSSFSDLTYHIIKKYQDHVLKLKKNDILLSREVMRKYLKYLENFFNWAARKNYILTNPASFLIIPKSSQILPKDILTEKQMQRVLEQPNIRKAYGLRDRAILEILYATGIRKAELLNLNLADINFNEQEIFIKDGKGKKDRIIPVSSRALLWLKRYLRKSRPLYMRENDQEALFINPKGCRLSANAIQPIIKRNLKKASIPAGSTHMFRHSMATHMLERGADIRYIQRILGHKDLASTEVYTRVGIVKLKEVHRKTHPTAGLGKILRED